MIIDIRPASESELAELQRVFRAAALSNLADRGMLLAHPELLALDGGVVAAGRTRVAVVEGQVTGFASTVVHDDELEIEDLFVDPRWQRRGIGHALIEDVVAVARRDGRSLVTVTANAGALAFYQALGFKRVGQVRAEAGPAPRLCLELSCRRREDSRARRPVDDTARQAVGADTDPYRGAGLTFLHGDVGPLGLIDLDHAAFDDPAIDVAPLTGFLRDHALANFSARARAGTLYDRPSGDG